MNKMPSQATEPRSAAPVWLTRAGCDLDAFRSLIETRTLPEHVPLASSIENRIPVYNGDHVRSSLVDHQSIGTFLTEWNRVFDSGAGVIVIREAYTDAALIDAVTDVLTRLIDAEEAGNGGGGDHFAPSGANSRLWNAHEKLCLADPSLFVRYNANPLLPLVYRAWLGPGYQVTTQVNVVRPGGQAQTCHRDYHMGFQTPAELEQYPATAHRLSAALTLQGAIAHSVMPLESGPTKLLPFSQAFLPGYLAAHREDFRDCFESMHVQLPLEKGDALFFNPALFHAAGDNRTTDVQRFANLMQIGSGYGRSIEIVDRLRMSIAAYPAISEMCRADQLDEAEIEAVIAATAEAYPFPANLDIESPLSGMAPPSQQDVLRDALREEWSGERLQEALYAQQGAKRSVK